MRPAGIAKAQRGVALMTAFVLLSIATVLSSAIFFGSTMTARRGAAIFSLEQSMMFAEAAEAIAAYALREDERSEDTLDEFWNRPYGPVEITPEASLAAKLEDLQGRFNINSLIGEDGKVDEASLAQFERLLALLDLESKWAPLVADWIDADVDIRSEGGEDGLYQSQQPPGFAGNLVVTSTSELMQLPGFGRERYAKLAPFVAALPRSSKINLCTASAEVLRSFGGDTVWQADFLARQREDRCFPEVSEMTIADKTARDHMTKIADKKSSYFGLTTWVRIGTTEVALYSLMYREPSSGTAKTRARPILRHYGTE